SCSTASSSSWGYMPSWRPIPGSRRSTVFSPAVISWSPRPMPVRSGSISGIGLKCAKASDLHMAAGHCNHFERESVVHRPAGPQRYVYWRCLKCGVEWTVADEVVDLAEVVSAEEIIDLHDFLQTSITLKEIIGG